MTTLRDLLKDFAVDIIDLAAATQGGRAFSEELDDKIDEYTEIIAKRFVGYDK